jgi:hypothetical protein
MSIKILMHVLAESLTEKLYDWGIRFWFPVQQGERFFPICSFQMGSMSHPASHAVGNGAVSLGCTGWLVHLAQHSHDVLRLRMRGRSCATNFPCVFIVRYLIKHRDNFNSAFVNIRNDQQWNLGLPKNFMFLWPCIVKVRWRENQQDATNLMFILKYLSQHVSGIIMPIFRRKRLCTTAYGVLPCNTRRRAVSCSAKVLYVV